MGLLKIEGVTHWSIPVNDLGESEKFYGDLLGLKPLGRLGDSGMSCFNVGDHNILLCQRAETVDKSFVEDHNVHHSFTVSPETLVQACKIFYEKKIPIDRLYYRGKGFSRAGSFISSILPATGSSCGTRLGSPGCPSPHSKTLRAPERTRSCRRQNFDVSRISNIEKIVGYFPPWCAGRYRLSLGSPIDRFRVAD